MEYIQKWLFLLFIVLCWEDLNFSGSKANAADVVTSCPEYFQAGQVNIITCTVNSTSITSAQCYPPATNIELQLTYSSGSLSPLCSSPYPNISCIQGDCFCANQSGDLLTYQFKIVADSTYEGGNLTCSICEVPIGITPQRVISSNCSTVKFVTTTTTTTSTTTTTMDKMTTMMTTITAITTIITTVTPITTKDLYYLLFLLLLLPAGLIICLCCFRWAKAVKDWDGHKKSNLRFKKGETITLLANEGSFWKGEINGRTGFFPKDFVRENSGNLRTAVALDDWNQDIELTFKRGNTICVTQQMETVWKGIRCCKIGWFPQDSVTLKEQCCVGKQSDSQNISMGSSRNIPNTSEKASLQSVELRSRSATLEESSSNDDSHRPPRAVPIPPSKLTPIERNSAKDLPVSSPGRRPLSPISRRKDDQ